MAGNKSVRICHLTSAHAHDDVRIFVKMCRSLAKCGYDVHLVASGDNVASVEIKDGVVVHLVPRRGGRWERMTKVSDSIVNEALNTRSDIYHFHDPELLRHVVRIKSKTARPIVYDVHEDVRLQIRDKKWIPVGCRNITSVLFGFYEDKVVGNVNAIVTATPAIAQRYSYHEHCITVNNYPLTEEYTHIKTDCCVKNDKRYFIYGGVVSKERGIKQIIEAMQYIDKDIDLVIAGRKNSDRLEHELSNVRLNNVKDLGFVKREEYLRWMSCASAGLLLFQSNKNHIEAQPNKLFEYMAGGIPIIASNFPLWREIIEEKVKCGILVDPMNPKQIAEAMNWIIDHQQEASDMGKRAREAVERKYNWDNEFKKLITMYNNLLD